jgi:hypothetical protein
MYNGLMRIAKRAGMVVVLLIMLGLAGQPVVAQNAGAQYFSETHHTVSGYFYDFFYTPKDPLTYFGYPITDAFLDSTGHLTQYFQRARFDLVMTDKGPVVVLADIGRYLYEDIGAAYNIVQNGPSCRPFPRTGKPVCYSFLQFYDAHQGDTYIGDPISGIEYRDGRYMQYFTKVRLEYDSNLPEGHKVIISLLGRPAFDLIVGDTTKLFDDNPGDGANVLIVPLPVTAITARAFVHDPLLAAGQQQTIYLIVQDQDLHPVKGAQASVLALYPDGSQYAYRPLDLTGDDGILAFTLPVSKLAPRQVVGLLIKVEFQGLKATASTWFRIWY